jgi:hypothetical protein
MRADPIAEPLYLHPEQVPAKKPWERTEGEPARWFFRFRNYLSMGSKRSINAVYEAEKQDKSGKSSNKAGTTWYSAAKRYRWQERAEAWDNEQDEQKAAMLREIALTSPFISKAYRLIQLNGMTDALSQTLEQGIDAVTFIAIAKQIQALMHDIRDELDEWSIHPDAACDAAAFHAYKQRSARLRDAEELRELDRDAETDKMIAKLEIYQQQIELMKKYH